MSLHVTTTQEKLDLIESLLNVERQESPRRAILRAIASDLRARLDGAPTVALVQLEQRVASVKRSQSKLGYSVGSMVSLAEQVIGAWPLLKQSVERFGAELNQAKADAVDDLERQQ